MPAYSASRNSANRSPVYSVYGPKMISESATGMSNGGRCSSASPATKKTNAASACQSSHHGSTPRRCRSATACRPPSPPTPRRARTAARRPSAARPTRIPPSENLLALAQPPISEPSTPTPITASTKNRPMSRSTPTSPGPTGITTSTTRYGISATAGASRNTVRSAAAGTTSSFCANFTPSATSCAQPWKPPAYIGPSATLHVRHRLVLDLPDEQRQRRGSDPRRRPAQDADLEPDSATSPPSGGVRASAALRRRARLVGRARLWRRPARGVAGGPGAAGGRRSRGPHCSGSGTPAGRGTGGARRRPRAPRRSPRLLRARPGLGDAGGEDEVLAQRVALEAVGEEQLSGERVASTVKSTPNISCVSRSCQPRRRTRAPPTAPARRRAHQGAQHEVVDRAGAVVGHRCTTIEPVGELVDRGQPVEEGAVEAVAGQPLDGGHPVLERVRRP